MFTKIHANTARAMNAKGLTIHCQASNLRPDGVMGAHAITDVITDWPQFRNAFKYYNCSAETGMGITFYTKSV